MKVSFRGRRQKGDQFERDVVNAFKAFRFQAERVPLSGAAGGSYCADITVRIGGVLRRFELKRRASTFNKLYTWLQAGIYGLVVRDDRRPALVVVPLEEFIRLAEAASFGKWHIHREEEVDAE